jgi:lipopolysaccharide/colanic/teichoic acid biosynthesis glycosyltransferase
MVSTANTFPFRFGARASAAVKAGTHAGALIVDEHIFMHMLQVERKRTERSGKPFVLVLVDGVSQLQGATDLQDLTRAIDGAKRQTDTIGWYQNGSMIGVLFTELGTTDCDQIERMVEKLESSVQEHIDAADAALLNISFHIYPEHMRSGDQSMDPRLYKDLAEAQAQKKVAHAAKRALDVAGSLFAILIFSPLFLFVAAAVKLTSKGPMLYRQDRIGHYGQKFTFLKFRSMYANNDPKVHEEYVKKLIAGASDVKQANGGFKLVNDRRITPIGRFIRRTSLDELPQFFNVLKGEMSLVGPRPPVPYEYDAYCTWHRRRILEVKPGITGLWQVQGRSRTTFDEMVRLDLQYAKNWTVGVDVMILMQTPKAVLSGSGAC